MRAAAVVAVVATLLVAAAPARAEPARGEPPLVELVETAPIETSLDHADIPEAADVWCRMIAGARRSIDLAEFYVTSAPHSRLSPVIDALYAAAARGVRVRLVVDDGFAKHEAATLAELGRVGQARDPPARHARARRRHPARQVLHRRR